MKQKVTEYKDILKLIVSTSEFDGNLLKQDNIEMIYTRSSNNVNLQPRAIVSCDPESQNPETWDDWFTSEIMIITALPQRMNLPKSYELEKPSQKPNASDLPEVSSKNAVHLRLLKNPKIVLFFWLTTLTVIFIMSLIISQKSRLDKLDKQKTSYYIFSNFLEKTKI